MKPCSKKVLRSLFEQKTSGTLCDVQLHVQGGSIWAHACILACCSIYFDNYFIEEQQKVTHWCVRNPLEIILGEDEMCLDCVCKIVDFMYLRELLVPQGHFQHFSKIVYFLKVLDLLPFCDKYFKGNNSTESISVDGGLSNLNSESLLPAPVVKTVISKNVEAPTLQSRDFSGSSILLLKGSKVGLASDFNKKLSQKQLYNLQSNNVCEKNEVSSLMVTNVSDGVSVPINHSKYNEDLSVVKCDFMCCNSDLKTKQLNPTSKSRQKRSMCCEVCQFKSISIKKMIKHLEETNHFASSCPICFLKEKDFGDLGKHLKNHNNLKPFCCHICQKRNKFFESHKLHMKVHCRNKQHCCKICHKTFHHKINLTNHLMLHNYKYFCEKCGQLSSNLNDFDEHMLQHGNEILHSKYLLPQSAPVHNNILNNGEKKFEIIKEFQCHVCHKWFSRKKNLSRHIQIQHMCNYQYKCSLCPLVTKRCDVLRQHMKRLHNCQPLSPKDTIQKKRKLESSIKDTEDVMNKNSIVEGEIPVKLMSTESSNTVIQSFTIQKCGNQQLVNNVESMNCGDIGTTQNYSQTKGLSDSRDSFQLTPFQEFSSDARTNNYNFNNVEASNKVFSEEHTNCKNINDAEVKSTVNTVKSTLYPKNNKQTLQIALQSTNSQSILIPGPYNNLHFNLLEESQEMWLSEATGEFLSGSNDSSMAVNNSETNNKSTHLHNMTNISNTNINKDPKLNINQCLSESISKLPLDFEQSLEALYSNTKDDLESNDRPVNVQNGFVDLENHDNMLSWHKLNDTFCSTWVLNEITGELNLVNFGLQPLKNSDKMKLDESTGTFSPIDDDETALFLNEGTGDLSVIYFNTNKISCESSNYYLNEQINQDNIETVSQHSNDAFDDDQLKEEFLQASADFMARDENKSFLNELTGEFHEINYSLHNSETTQSKGTEYCHLNEETGEMTLNAINENINSDLLLNNDPLAYDFDDSLNCEDFEHFSTDVNEFSSQFCLDNSNDWVNNFNESCDTLLNECTGELIKKT